MICKWSRLKVMSLFSQVDLPNGCICRYQKKKKKKKKKKSEYIKQTISHELSNGFTKNMCHTDAFIEFLMWRDSRCDIAFRGIHVFTSAVLVNPKSLKAKKWRGLGRQRAALSESCFLTHPAIQLQTSGKDAYIFTCEFRRPPSSYFTPYVSGNESTKIKIRF